jgi:hypothetical protein
MDHPPIILSIAGQCDMKSLLTLMIVNKKYYRVVKHFIENAPSIYLATYFIDTSGEPPEKVIYSSLRALFTELHRFRLNIQGDNYAGPCADSLDLRSC